ncbi:MAG: SDR family NAD(P)-dependent oxidoreductase [Spirochaetes bacterium]|nr:SDR family NAD(P)-dependent oxidoreductase [Spirochaetota bacterium]
MLSIKGKKAIVTGGGMGIGRATARMLVAEGVDVAICDVNAAALKETVRELKGAGPGRVFAYQCDVTKREAVLTLVRKAVSDMGGVDILVNNAGIERHGRFCAVPLSEWEKVVDVNLLSIFYTTHAVLPRMYERNSGWIVNISSAAGIIGVADLAAYCATKWAVWGFTESIRLEVIADGKDIHVASVHPHFLKEGLFAGGHLNRLGELLLPRIKSPDIVARAIVGKAVKKRRNTVKIPATLHLGALMRGLVPDFIIMFLASKVFGIGKSMEDWVGRAAKKTG